MEWLTLNPILCVGWIIVGAIAGAAARTLLRRPDAPFIQDLILGLAGALIGGFVAGLLSLGPGTTLETQGIERVLINLVISIVGAVILLFLGNTLMRRR
ncbi:MAG: GlsB/YeaQ/YmgE family stress response membrane protein [Anaerolineae bacterium]|nr:GlsB/YeaQ/YmgE family stress response membrane protein [Anaerolineae bacterium]